MAYVGGWPLRASSAMHLAKEDMEARFAPVKCESGTRTPRTRSQKSTSSTSANESMPASDNGLFSSNSTPSATKLVRANSHSFAAIIFGSFSGVIAVSILLASKLIKMAGNAKAQCHNMSRQKYEAPLSRVKSNCGHKAIRLQAGLPVHRCRRSLPAQLVLDSSCQSAL